MKRTLLWPQVVRSQDNVRSAIETYAVFGQLELVILCYMYMHTRGKVARVIFMRVPFLVENRTNIVLYM